MAKAKKKKVKRDAADILALLDYVEALVRLPDESSTEGLGLHQTLSWCVERPPGEQHTEQSLGLHQGLDLEIERAGLTEYEPIPLQGWEALHRLLFIRRESARGRAEELVSALLLVLHEYDTEPPETVSDASERLEVILYGTNALKPVRGVLAGLSAGIRLGP